MPKIFFFEKKVLPLHRKWELTDGVMVTLQILVLSFKVRVLVGQQRKKHRKSDAFFVVYFLLPIGSAAKPLFNVCPRALLGHLQCVAVQVLYSPKN